MSAARCNKKSRQIPDERRGTKGAASIKSIEIREKKRTLSWERPERAQERATEKGKARNVPETTYNNVQTRCSWSGLF